MINLVNVGGLHTLEKMDPMKDMIGMSAEKVNLAINVEKASFLDIFKGMVQNVITTNEQVDRDAIDLLQGNIDNIAEMQENIAKAGIAVDLLVTVKNEVLSAYNSIINMQI